MEARFFCLLFTLFLRLTAASQELPEPIARFTFNRSSDRDEINDRKVKLQNVSFTEDRFGNDHHAVFIAGNPESYINLGNYAQLKPVIGTISLWVRIEYVLYWGRGTVINPILLTKNTDIDDYYESYAISYMPEKGTLNGVCSKDETYQASIHHVGKVPLFKWMHIALSFDDDFVTLYLDSRQIGRVFKKFRTKYLVTDSVMVGVTANKKNNRCSMITVDDIQYFDRVLNQDQISQLFHAPDPNQRKNTINFIFLIAGIVMMFVLLYLLIRLRIMKTLRKQRARLELSNHQLETELRVNRALMNPHFVFNSLNALHNFILAGENDLAGHYLVKFSKLIRQILESNSTGTISLDLEIEILNKYLEIEALRFEKQINYRIVCEEGLVPSAISIPIMMIQPFVENAIWHGLLRKQGEKNLNIFFAREGKHLIECRIEDDGVGRATKDSSREQKKSMAIAFILQRLDLLNKIYQINCRLLIIDKADGKGTIVVITLPIINSFINLEDDRSLQNNKEAS